MVTESHSLATNETANVCTPAATIIARTDPDYIPTMHLQTPRALAITKTPVATIDACTNTAS